MRKSLAAAALSVFGAVVLVQGVVACSSSKPPPPSTPTTDSGSDASMAIAPPPASDAGPAPVATGPTFFTQDAGSSATPPPAPVGDQAMDSAIDLAISASAAKLAPGMAPEGAAGRATLKEGEHFSMIVTLAPNRCYTFIGFSAPGQVNQMDLKLMGVALAIEAGKSSPPDKLLPGFSVMGKTTTAICPVLPVAVPYKVDVAATKGAGRIGVQTFAKNK